IRFPQDCFAIRGNAMARKSSMSRADFRASGIRIPNGSFGIRMTEARAACEKVDAGYSLTRTFGSQKKSCENRGLLPLSAVS
ncbi:hypothetical protein, partial [Rhodoblastus sp.]|uniref:hypothetical protein n=1 Tax=Rhodoblastus sp. TaxID=1962975 RepID=UPI003FD895F5